MNGRKSTMKLVNKNWSVDVMAALDLVREEVGKVIGITDSFLLRD